MDTGTCPDTATSSMCSDDGAEAATTSSVLGDTRPVGVDAREW